MYKVVQAGNPSLLSSAPYFPASPFPLAVHLHLPVAVSTFMCKMYAFVLAKAVSFSFSLLFYLHPADICVHTHAVTDILYFLHFHQQVINTNYRGKRAPAGITELPQAV